MEKNTIADIQKQLSETFPGDKFEFFQSNIEGEIISKIHEAECKKIDGVIINPGGYDPP